MRKNLFILLIALILGSIAAITVAGEPNGREIIQKMRDRPTASTSIMQVRMTITDSKGVSRDRTVINRMKKYPTGTKTVIVFLQPDDVKGTKFLVIENKNGEDDQFLYTPQLKRVRRINSQQKSGSFMGTDFSYSDLQSYDPDRGEHKRLADQVVAGQDCYQIQTTPKEPGEYEYSKIVYWVRKDNYIPIKAEFYDLEGRLLKTLEVRTLEQDSQGTWIVKDSIMRNVQKNHSTRMQTLQVQNNVAIADDYFTERYLTDETKM